MKFLKINSLLAMLVLSFFMFTACEDDPNPIEPEGTPLPAKVKNLNGAGISATEIKINWGKADADSSWFKDYIITVKEGETVVKTDTIAKTLTTYTFNAATIEKVYAISVLGRNTNDSSNAANTATFTWATSKQYDKNYNESNITVYANTSSTYGSGLELSSTSEDGYPKTWKLDNYTKWNLAFAKTGIKIGSASEAGYAGSGTPADAFITPLETWDGNALNDGPFQTSSLESKSWSKKLIDLENDPIATNATKGVCFYARVGEGASAHYAKVIVLKEGGKFVQGSAPDTYLHLKVSYQTAAGVPYAKTAVK